MPYEVVADVAMVRRISGAALDDTDALMMASKRHDQQLLSAINARLVRFIDPLLSTCLLFFYLHMLHAVQLLG